MGSSAPRRCCEDPGSHVDGESSQNAGGTPVPDPVPGSGLEPVELRAVTVENFDAVIALDVSDDQRVYLDSNVESLAWAYVAIDCHPLAIVAGGTPVGLAAYGHVPADGRTWIVHFMVDRRWQRRGVGRAALGLLLAHVDAVSGGAAIGVAVHPDNAPAVRLYEAFGFSDTGRVQNGEIVMRRDPLPSEDGPPEQG